MEDTIFSENCVAWQEWFLGTKHWYKGILKEVNLQGHILNKNTRITKGTIVNYNLVFKWFKMIIEVSDTLC